MTAGCALLAIALASPGAVLLPKWLRSRARRRQRNVFSRWPVRMIPVEELDPVFRPGPLGPTIETDARLIGGASLTKILGGTSDAEAWILAVLAKRARCLFEFGTATGRTTYLWAVNSPPDAKISTLTLAPDDHASFKREGADHPSDVKAALEESRFTSFYYSGTAAASKVEQLFGDSKTFDGSAWAGKCDLVFVDGSHAYSYVMSDSRKAIAMAKPGGLVLWHDYRGRKVPGVYQALNELSKELPLVHVKGTALVAWRKPSA